MIIINSRRWHAGYPDVQLGVWLYPDGRVHVGPSGFSGPPPLEQLTPQPRGTFPGLYARVSAMVGGRTWVTNPSVKREFFPAIDLLFDEGVITEAEFAEFAQPD